MDGDLPKMNMFWHGPRLGPVHAACIRSFLRHGHAVVLHCYEPPEDVPDGVEIFDATQIMPRSDLIANAATGSVSLGTNRYRYRLLRSGDVGIYSDCDMYCLRPIPDSDYVFGWEDVRIINGAFLKYPADSDLARTLVAETVSKYPVPDHFGPRRKCLLRALRTVGLGISVEKMRWGVWGPRLLTTTIDKLGLQDKAQPIDRYYPLHFSCVPLLYDPGLRVEDLVTPRTYALHLWHSKKDSQSLPEGCPLHQIVNS
jgi:hypothetical protein